MKRPSRLLTLFLVITLITNSILPLTLFAAEDAPFQTVEAVLPAFDHNYFTDQPHSKWTNLVSNTAPATFSQVSYTLADNVVELDSSNDITVRNALADIKTAGMRFTGATNTDLAIAPNRIIAEGGYISSNSLEALVGSNIAPGTVFVDKGTGTSFKITTPFSSTNDPQLDLALSNTHRISTPELNEVVQSFSFGGNGETISLTPGNMVVTDEIFECIEDKTTLQLLASGDDEFKHVKDHQWPFPLSFDSKDLMAYSSGGSKVQVRLTGGLSVGDLKLSGRYSAPFGKYEVALSFKQEFYLTVTFAAQLNEEVYIPIIGINVPFGIGSVKGGLYLVMTVDGNFRLEIKTREWTSPRMGVQGATFACLPATIHPLFTLGEKGFDGDVSLNGRLNANARIGPMLDINIFGFDLVGAGAFVGAGVSVTAKNDLLNINLYAIVNVYVKAFGKTFNLINWKPSILQKKQADTGGYLVEIAECYAFKPGRIGGTIKKEPRDTGDLLGDFIPAEGLPYRIKVVHPDNTVDYFPAGNNNSLAYAQANWYKTNSRGEFYVGNGTGTYGDDGIPIYVTDKVSIEFFGEDNLLHPCNPVQPEFGFTSYTLHDAEYFNDYATGQVMPQRFRNWNSDDPYATELLYFSNNIVSLTQFYIPMYNEGIYLNGGLKPTSAPALVMTDELGCFDTRTPFSIKDENGAILKNYTFGFIGVFPNNSLTLEVNSSFDVSSLDPIYSCGLVLTIDCGGPAGVNLANTGYYNVPQDLDHYIPSDVKDIRATNESLRTLVAAIRPRMAPLIFSRETIPVESSYKRFSIWKGTTEYTVESMQYDDYVRITNPNGTRAVDKRDLYYSLIPQSYVDIPNGFVNLHSNIDEKDIEERKLTFEEVFNLTNAIPTYLGDKNGAKIQQASWDNYVIDKQVVGKTAVTTLAQRVTVEWVWQAHPNPVRVTTVVGKSNTAGGTVQVEALGWFPAFAIEGAPTGITINRDTGLLTVPEGLAPNTYSFKVSAIQDYRPIDGYDYAFKDDALFNTRPITRELIKEYYGHDAAPIDVRDFHLVIDKLKPTILPEDHNFTFVTNQGQGLTIPFRATGDPTLFWNLIYEDMSQFSSPEDSMFSYTSPEERDDFINIDSQTGIVTIDPSAPAGRYEYGLEVSNIERIDYLNEHGNPESFHSGGRDVKTFTLTINEDPDALMINFASNNYNTAEGTSATLPFSLVGTEPYTVSVEVIKESEVIEGFIVDLISKTVIAPDNLGTGIYEVKAIVQNATKSSDSSCTLEVRSALAPITPPSTLAPVAKAPTLTFTNNQFQSEQGQSFTTNYTLTGTEPITVTVTGKTGQNVTIAGFTIDSGNKKVSAPSNLMPGVYIVTATAKNQIGESSASFKLEVVSSVIAPKIAFMEATSQIAQNETASFTYTLSGSEPITLTLQAETSREVAITGFTIDEENKTIKTPASLAPGTYTITLKATNSVGEDTDSLALEVITQAKPPLITVKEPRISLPFGAGLQIPYILTGTEPIVVEMEVQNPSRSSISGITLNQTNKQIQIANNTPIGSYSITLKATNSVGNDSVSLNLDINALTEPPHISFAKDTSSTPEGSSLRVPYTVSGSEPLSYSLTLLDSKGASLAGLSQNENMKEIIVNDSLPAGNYTITISAKNDAGTASASSNLEVYLPATPPILTVPRDQVFNTSVGKGGAVIYYLSGSEPITVTLEARSTTGAPIDYFVLDTQSRTVQFNERLPSGSYNILLMAKNEIGIDQEEFVITIEPPAMSAPYITNKIKEVQMTNGTDYTLQLQATGTEPLYWHLEAIPALTHRAEVPTEASISESGLLTIDSSIAAGNYSFVVRVSNPIGSDDFTLYLEVQEGKRIIPLDPIRPIIRPNSGFSNNVRPSSLLNVQDLKPNLDQPNPFLLTDIAQKKNSSAATLIATQNSSLLNSSISTSSIIDYTYAVDSPYQMLEENSFANLAKEHLSKVEQHIWDNITFDPLLPAIIERPAPPNQVTIRWDHSDDIYTHDSLKNHDFSFISWIDRLNVMVLGEPFDLDFYYGYKNDPRRGAENLSLLEFMLKDLGFQSVLNYTTVSRAYLGDLAFQFNDAYHKGYWPTGAKGHTAPPVEEEATLISKADLVREASRLEAMSRYVDANGPFGPGHGINIDDFFGTDGSGFPIDPFNDSFDDELHANLGDWIGSYKSLDYGVTLEAMASQKGGVFEVPLGDLTGTVITGKYFSQGLHSNPEATIAFKLDGASIEFTGKDLSESVSQHMLYDFGFYQNTYMQSLMEEAVGASGGENFSYSFTHHGALPGTATFNIQTDIASGSKVNVYRFDASTGDFTLIADNLTVGSEGTVTYRNNTMSHYLITTIEIPWALSADQTPLVSQTEGNNIILAIGFLAIAGVVATSVLFFLRIRKKRMLNS